MTRRYDEVTEGAALEPWTYRVVREDLVRYAAASGDQNPIHQDEEFATSVGLPNVIAHGMQTMAKMGQYLADWCGDPGAVTRFKTRFTAPVVVPAGEGNEVTVTGRVAERLGNGRVRIEVEAATGDVNVARGDAEVKLGS